MGKGPRRDEPAVGYLARVIMEALTERDRLKAEGASPEDLAEGFERVVRSVWPKSRDRSWKFLCDRCQDTGLEMRVCRPGDRCDGVSSRSDGRKEPSGKYVRPCTTPSDYEHEYGVACDCPKGQRFRAPAPSPDDDFQGATKGKARKMKTFGR